MLELPMPQLEMQALLLDPQMPNRALLQEQERRRHTLPLPVLPSRQEAVQQHQTAPPAVVLLPLPLSKAKSSILLPSALEARP